MNSKFLTSLALTFAMTLLSCSLNVNNGLTGASPTISGTISADTTWTRADSPYNVSGSLAISNDSVLTIEPGVTVYLNDATLLVYGKLVAQGSDRDIHFHGGTINFASNQIGSVLEECVLTEAMTVTVTTGFPRISRNVINGQLDLKGGEPIVDGNVIDTRLRVTDGSPTISNNVISDGIHADSKGGPVVILSNQISVKSGFPAIYLQGIHADISGNNIVGNGANGINLWLAVTSATISSNQISKCAVGILTSDGNIEVNRNVIYNNTLGIYAWNVVNIHDNTIALNLMAINCTHGAINNNNFINNTYHNIKDMWLADVDATNNWWGTIDINQISQTLIRNSNLSGTIKFLPILTSPNIQAPSLPEELSPTPTPTIPEFPLLAIIVLFSAITLTSALMLKKRSRL